MQQLGNHLSVGCSQSLPASHSKPARRQIFTYKHTFEIPSMPLTGDLDNSPSVKAYNRQQEPWEYFAVHCVLNALRVYKEAACCACGRLRVWVSSSSRGPAGCVTGDGSHRRGMGGVWEGCVIPITPRSCQHWTSEGCGGAAATAQAKFVFGSLV